MGKKTKISNFCFLNKLKCCIFAAEILLNCIRLIKTIYINNKLKQKIMKKFFTSIVIALCAMSANAQTYMSFAKSEVFLTTDANVKDQNWIEYGGTSAKKKGSINPSTGETLEAPTSYDGVGVKKGNSAKSLVLYVTGVESITVYGVTGSSTDARTLLVTATAEDETVETATASSEPSVTAEVKVALDKSKKYKIDITGVDASDDTKGADCAVQAVWFIVDGRPTAIANVSANKANENAPVYNLNGQKVSKDYKGVVVKNGKKYIQK